MLLSDNEFEGDYNDFDDDKHGAVNDSTNSSNNIKVHIPRTITIDNDEAVSDIVLTIIYIVWLAFFIRDFLTLDKSIMFTYRPILLLIFLLEVFYNTIKHLRINYINHVYKHETMLFNEYVNKIYKTKLLDTLLSLIFFANCVLLALEFAPFTNSNCYDYSKGLCTEGRIATIFGMILTVILLTVLIVGVCTLVNMCIFRTSSPNMYINRILNIKVFYDISITRNIINFFNLTNRCPICLTNVDESEYTNHTTHTKIPGCKHKMHQQCIEKIISDKFVRESSLSCLICGVSISNTNNNVDESIA
jgi:hypothetical protein